MSNNIKIDIDGLDLIFIAIILGTAVVLTFGDECPDPSAHSQDTEEIPHE